MSLRMSICAVISLGLTAGAHWVAGQAAQAPPESSAVPPRLAGGPSGDASASKGGDGRAAVLAGSPSTNAPPRLAIPGARPQADGSESGADAALPPPRVVTPAEPSPASVSVLPDLPVNVDTPPPVDEPPPPSTSPGAPIDVPPMLAAGGSESGPDPFASTGADPAPPLVSMKPAYRESAPDASAGIAGEAGIEPADDAGQFTAEGLPSSFPVTPGAVIGAADLDDRGPGFDESLPAEPVGASDDSIFSSVSVEPMPEPGDDDVFPGFGAAQAGGTPSNPADLADEPFAGTSDLIPPGLPSDDPGAFADFGAVDPVEPPPAIPPAGPVGGTASPMPRPASEPPDFASTGSDPLADPAIRASAAPRDGVGAMAATLADRLSEGPRDVQLNIDVAVPQHSNINLPMKAVIALRNEGRDDAFDVVIRLPLPDGLEFTDSSPPPDSMEDEDRTLLWRWGSLPAGDSRTIDLTVKPLKAEAMDFVPRVTSVMAAKSRTTVQKPELKIDLSGPNGEVLKGDNIDFQVSIRNTGNGPARGVNLVATLTGGLQGYDQDGSLNNATRFELEIGDLAPGEVRGPFPLSVLADSQGTHTCSIQADSPDVVPPTPPATKNVVIVAPDLKLDVVGPDSRPVGSVAEYVVTITNAGTAAATDVAVALFAPENGKPDIPKNAAKYQQDPEKRLHSIYWRIPRLDKGQSQQFRVPIRLDRIAIYTVEVAAHSEGFREPKDTRRDQQATSVMGIADVKIVNVDRKDTVIDAGDTTQFEIRIRNDGSKEATNVKVDFYTNEWIKVERTDPPDAFVNPNNPVQHGFAPIDRLSPGVERTFVVVVKAQKAPASGQAVANFDVKVFWDDLPEEAAVSSNSHVRIAEGQIARSPTDAPR